MQVVTRFKAEDGEEFLTKEECLSHEEGIRVSTLVASHMCYGNFEMSNFSKDDRGSLVLYESDLNKFIAANVDVLWRILAGTPTAILEVEGGAIHNVTMTGECNVLILDSDTEGVDLEDVRVVDNTQVWTKAFDFDPEKKKYAEDKLNATRAAGFNV